MRETVYACRFCGQIADIEDIPLNDARGNQLDGEEAATRVCQCAEAVMYRKKRMIIEKAKDNADNLFSDGCLGEGFDSAASPAVLEWLYSQIDAVADGMLLSASAYLPKIGTVKIGVSGKGGIVVQRQQSKVRKLLADAD